MKLSKNSWPLGLLALGAACGLLASASVLAAAPAGGAAAGVGAGVPGYMVTAASLDNAAYMACVKKNLKLPAEQNVVAGVAAALACQGAGTH